MRSAQLPLHVLLKPSPLQPSMLRLLPPLRQGFSAAPRRRSLGKARHSGPLPLPEHAEVVPGAEALCKLPPCLSSCSHLSKAP